MSERMRIGELAERAKVTPRTVRYYESIGLIPSGERKGSGQHYYTEETVVRLRKIDQLKQLGLNLDESVLNALLVKVGMANASVEFERFSETARKRIQDDFAGGIRSGVNGTPTFFLNGTRYDGPTDYDSLVAVMEQVLTSDGD